MDTNRNFNGVPGQSPPPEPDEYNLYLGFMIPIGAILILCILCLFVISWQLIFPKCSVKYCPKMFLDSSTGSTSSFQQTPPNGQRSHSRQNSVTRNRRASVTLVRRHSDFPPTYEALTELPPSYNSVVIIEEETTPRAGDRSSRCSGIRTYVYDPSRRISIEIHDEDTIRVVEELLSRRRSSIRSGVEPPGYSVIDVTDNYPSVFTNLESS